VGVSNPRNACYAIASIQMLYSLPFLRKYYTELKEEDYDSIQYDFKRTLKLHEPPEKYDNDLINARNHLNGITEFFNLMNNATNEKNISISDEKCNLITHDTQNQQDVSEYLTLMRSIYIYNDATRILSYQELSCNNGKKVRLPEEGNEEFLSLEITLKKETKEKNKKDLNSCIESFNNDYEYGIFERCKNNDNNDKVNNAKRFYIIPPENRYLLISLKRFSYNNNASKIQSSVEPNKTIIIGGVKYTLSGVIFHSGDDKQGHYIFIQCNKDGDFNKIYNDSIVSVFNENQEYDTDFINKNGYIFAYTRYPVDQSNADKRLLTIFKNTEKKENDLQQNVFRPITPNPNP
jgi:ubiquitin C-terminal hydrolase